MGCSKSDQCTQKAAEFLPEHLHVADLREKTFAHAACFLPFQLQTYLLCAKWLVLVLIVLYIYFACTLPKLLSRISPQPLIAPKM